MGMQRKAYQENITWKISYFSCAEQALKTVLGFIFTCMVLLCKLNPEKVNLEDLSTGNVQSCDKMPPAITAI